MSKFTINSVVRYAGNNKSMQDWFRRMIVEDVIPDGAELSTGEINISGQTIYMVRRGYTRYHFLESELAKY